jgi:hypothetical protein
MAKKFTRKDYQPKTSINSKKKWRTAYFLVILLMGFFGELLQLCQRLSAYNSAVLNSPFEHRKINWGPTDLHVLETLRLIAPRMAQKHLINVLLDFNFATVIGWLLESGPSDCSSLFYFEAHTFYM